MFQVFPRFKATLSVTTIFLHSIKLYLDHTVDNNSLHSLKMCKFKKYRSNIFKEYTNLKLFDQIIYHTLNMKDIMFITIISI